MASSYNKASWPIPLPALELTGDLVRLEALTLSHIDELAVAGNEAEIWEFTTSYGATPEAMRAYVLNLRRDWEQGSALPFAVRSLSSSAVVGCTRLKDIARAHRHATVGSWYARSAWRTGVNLEAKLLLLDHAFSDLGCIRIEFHADVRNRRSCSSLERLGARREGVLRAHQITRGGSLRDSAVYSVLQEEWPAVRTGIVARLRR